jgi:hypothetical protein
MIAKHVAGGQNFPGDIFCRAIDMRTYLKECGFGVMFCQDG